jgi:hypothetical protein
MAIEQYYGTDGYTITISNGDDLLEVVDIIHTLTMDNIGEDSPFLKILEDAMEKIESILLEG